MAQLYAHFGVSALENLMDKLGTDIRYIAPRYIGPELKSFPDGSCEGLYGQRFKSVAYDKGSFNETVYRPFAEVTDASELDRFPFPSADWFDCSRIAEDADRYGAYAVASGYPASTYSGAPGYGVSPPCAPDFINGTARLRGMEQILIDIALEEPVYIALTERMHKLSMDIYKRVLEAGKGKIDILYLADDLGNQNSTIISPRSFERLFADKYRDLFALAHKYGAKTMMHCCGSVRAFIPRLINLGLDILDVLQPEAAGMEIGGLKNDFYKNIVFAGGMCIQKLLPFGSKEEVRAEVGRRKKMFPDGGLILGPSNNLQTDTPLENILEMYDAITSI